MSSPLLAGATLPVLDGLVGGTPPVLEGLAGGTTSGVLAGGSAHGMAVLAQLPGVETLASHYTYYVVVALLGLGLYAMIEPPNLVKKVIGMNLFQTGIFLFFITAAYRADGAAPVVHEGGGPYVSPLPHVLILTAIVVGVSLTAVALALVVRIYATYGTLDENELRRLADD